MNAIVNLKLANLTKSQKAALTILGIDYKNIDITKDNINAKVFCKSKKTVIKESTVVFYNRNTIRCASTDALVAYNIEMMQQGKKPCSIEKACERAYKLNKRVDTLMYEKEDGKITQKEWMRKNIKIILSSSDEEIIKACNDRLEIAESYIKAKG